MGFSLPTFDGDDWPDRVVCSSSLAEHEIEAILSLGRAACLEH